jgi:hypothetical protein
MSKYVVLSTEREYIEYFGDPEKLSLSKRVIDVNRFGMSVPELREWILNEERDLNKYSKFTLS